MGFWEKDELEEFKKANPKLTEGLSDSQIAELAEDERATQEGMLGRDFTEEGEA